MRDRAARAGLGGGCRAGDRAVFEYGIETGEEDEGEEDDERWLWVTTEGSRDGYRDMERFIAGIEAPEIAVVLARALDGRGVFRRFRNQLARWPEVQDRWYAYSDERRRGRARSWLAAEGYTPAQRLGRTQPGS